MSRPQSPSDGTGPSLPDGLDAQTEVVIARNALQGTGMTPQRVYHRPGRAGLVPRCSETQANSREGARVTAADAVALGLDPCGICFPEGRA